MKLNRKGYMTIEIILAAVVTFVICSGGVIIGKRFGTHLSNKSLILGGSILIFIGVEILIKGII